MSAEKTRFEEEYFAREEAEKQHKLATQVSSKRARHEADALKAAHFHKCPDCGNDLKAIPYRKVEIWRCFHCRGTWLHGGDLEKLAALEGPHPILDALVNVFK